MLRIAALSFVLAIPTQAYSQAAFSPAECAHALVPDQVTFSRDYQRSLSILSILTEDNFEEESKKFDWSAAGVVFGAPFRSDMNFDEFNAMRNQTYKEFRFAESVSDKTFLSVTSFDSANARYRDCLSLLARQSDAFGFKTWIGSVTDDYIDVYFYWDLPNTSNDSVKLKVGSPIGARLDDEVPAELTKREERFVTFLREKDQNGVSSYFRVKISASGRDYLLELPGEPDFTVPCEMKAENDSYIFFQFSRHVNERFRTPTGCEITQDYAIFSDLKLDLACVTSITDVSTSTHVPKRAYDCTGTQHHVPLSKITYKERGTMREALLSPYDTNCGNIAAKFADHGLEVPPAFCR